MIALRNLFSYFSFYIKELRALKLFSQNQWEVNVFYLKTEKNHDYVRILDANGTLRGSCSGTQQSDKLKLIVNSSSLTITFTSDATVNNEGFDLNFYLGMF